MTSLKIQYEVVKSLSLTESLQIVAGQIFGTANSKPKEKAGTSAADLLAFLKGAQ